jgi:hypothetical protein
MGIKMPEPDKAGWTLQIENCNKNTWPPYYFPDVISGTAVLTEYEENHWLGSFEIETELMPIVVNCGVIFSETETTISVYANTPSFYVLQSWAEPTIFEGYDEGPPFNAYTGGNWKLTGGKSEANEVAGLVGIPYADKTFYEPMPLAVNPKSYRFARQPDGTRIYIRTGA